jgi:hypothetical protein
VESELTLHSLRPPRTQVPFSVPLLPTSLLPVPDKATFCGLSNALSVTENVPVRTPEACGEKVMPIVQLAPGGRVDPHVSISENSALAAMLTIFSVPVAELFSEMACAGLVVPIT